MQSLLNTTAQIAVPVASAILMFCIGLGLDRAAFVRTFSQPRAVVIALICQLLVPPLLALVLVRVIALDPIMAMGLVLVAACPVATPTNLLTKLARANVSFSVTLTAATSLFAAVTVPISLWAAANSNSPVAGISLWRIAVSLTLIATAPVLAGMALRHMRPELTRKLEKLSTRIAVVCFVGGVGIAIAGVWDQIALSFAQVGLAVVILNVSTLAAAHGIALLAGLGDEYRIGAVLGAGTRRFTMASFVALTLFNDARLLLPAVAYALTMWATSLAIVAMSRRNGVAAPGGSPTANAPVTSM